MARFTRSPWWHRGQKGFPLGPPYVLAIVELEEGPRMMTNLVDVAPDPAAIRIGMPVEVVFQDVTDEIALPQFRPREGPHEPRSTAACGAVSRSSARPSRTSTGKLPHKSAFMLHAEAARNALADAGLAVQDVDAVFTAGLWMGSGDRRVHGHPAALRSTARRSAAARSSRTSSTPRRRSTPGSSTWR